MRDGDEKWSRRVDLVYTWGARARFARVHGEVQHERRSPDTIPQSHLMNDD
jgi:hypothetical protein